MRLPIALAVLVAICACAAPSHRVQRIAKQRYVAALQAVPVPMRNGIAGVTTLGVMVSGTIVNHGSRPVRCSPTSFVIVAPSGQSTGPSSAFCQVSPVAPGQSAGFNARFAQAPTANLHFRFEHGDGSYEDLKIVVPRA